MREKPTGAYTIDPFAPRSGDNPVSAIPRMPSPEEFNEGAQYPINPPSPPPEKPKAKEVNFYDGRRLCIPERRISEVWPFAMKCGHTFETLCDIAKVVSWYRESPVTVEAIYPNGTREVVVVEPAPLEGTITVCTVRDVGSGRRKVHKFETDDRTRIRNRIMDLNIQGGSFRVSLMFNGVDYPFYDEHFEQTATWKLTGPRHVKQSVERDLMSNFNNFMEALASKLNGAKAKHYRPATRDYIFYMWDVTLDEANIGRVKQALESTGWDVVSITTDSESTDVVIR